MKKTFLATIAMIFIIWGCTHKKSVKMVQIKGSDTLLNLVQALSEKYMKIYPDKAISVTGGGSGVGIAAIVDGKTDIADASRSIKEKELKLAQKKGRSLLQFIIARDGLSVIVNKDLPVDSLTLRDIGKIYRGEIKNYKEVGGPDLPISLYGRTNASGTYVYFREHVVKGEYSTTMKSMNGNSQIVEAIKRDKAGIGYVGIGYIRKDDGRPIEGVKAIKIKISDKDSGFSPFDTAAVNSGKYPLTRPLFQYIEKNTSKEVIYFIKFSLSAQAHEIINKIGFFLPTSEDMRQNNETLKKVKIINQ